MTLSVGYGEKWSDSRCFLKVISIEFANGLDVNYTGERESWQYQDFSFVHVNMKAPSKYPSGFIKQQLAIQI